MSSFNIMSRTTSINFFKLSYCNKNTYLTIQNYSCKDTKVAPQTIDLAKYNKSFVSKDCLQSKCANISLALKDDLIKLLTKAHSNNIKLKVNSAYRSYDEQIKVFKNSIKGIATHPGTSEHQLGLAIDFSCKDVEFFKDSNCYKWMQKNSTKFGFFQRYTKKQEKYTKIKEEQWHYRYVNNLKIAKLLSSKNISLEEFGR